MGLFKTDEDRKLWIRLNAERQIAWEKGLTYFDKTTGKNLPTLQALHPRSMEEALEISENQCKYDEKEGKLRFTFEELLLLDINELNKIQRKDYQEWCKKFGKLK